MLRPVSRRSLLGWLSLGASAAAPVSGARLAGDGVQDDWPALSELLAANQTVTLGPNTYRVTRDLAIPAGKTLAGVPGKTVIQGARGFNILVPQSNSTVIGITVDGAFADDDRTGASGVVLAKASGVRLENVSVQNISFQGFALISSDNNRIINCSARNCGHRGINVSASSHNEISGFRAHDCWRAGVLFGYRANDNVAHDFYADGFRDSVGGAGLWLSFDCDANRLTDFTIGPQRAGGTRSPSILVAAGCVGNVFERGTILGAGDRAIYIWNENVDHVQDLHTANAVMERNRFKDIVIQGTGVRGSYGIGFKSDNGQKIGSNEFDNIRISGFDIGIADLDAHAAGLRFRNIRFERIAVQNMRLLEPQP